MPVNNIESNPVKLPCGVPEGSVLEAVLFALCTTLLVSTINRQILKYHFYPDDLQLPNSASPENVHTLLKTTSDFYSDFVNCTGAK